ncbi:hypothetical protein Poli38472_004179 [Pythium oligandrum]|uniref:Lysosomal Pro-X carboxypeptidase n=1 Tax=Pythium oligandrum TaxID=41045 RepID=A0A8K1CMV4_PYTOL|nr:hypothetical protein Poli38472_004179 [Pythium oligandrum]|eukprot:TMW66414.1 hypothetical protein Poli38472_004179 [Pythium oligandrum]
MTASELLPMLRPHDGAIQRRHEGFFKRLPLICAVVGALLAPIVLFVDFHSAKNVNTNDNVKNVSINNINNFTPLRVEGLSDAVTSAYELNPDGTPNLLKECKELYFTQMLDHFIANSPTYEERYFVCDKYSRKDGVIFFYVGNEADVELYLNNTGLMWENAEEFGAMLVFAEHRYFGKSVPFGSEVRQHMQYLSTEQALADYAVLIEAIKEEYKLDVPVVGFGGSYGGMLGSWFRMKYPHILDGVIAASAPILSYIGDEKAVDMESFARITTFDASPEAGSSEQCVPNVRRSWQVIRELGKTDDGRKDIATAFSLCDTEKLDSEEDVESLIQWIKSAFDYLAMGNYPYPSPYIMNGKSVLPPYPVRVACDHLKFTYAESDHMGLLEALRDGVGVYYNSTFDAKCFQTSPPSNESAADSNFWDYIYCSESYQPTSLDGEKDMFWPVPWNLTADAENCKKEWNITLRPHWAVTQYGGRKALKAASNIVLSNGDYDPWSGTGVLEDFSDSVVYVPVEGGAHHLDLFFSNDMDPPAVKEARATELKHIKKWVREYYDQIKKRET